MKRNVLDHEQFYNHHSTLLLKSTGKKCLNMKLWKSNLVSVANSHQDFLPLDNIEVDNTEASTLPNQPPTASLPLPGDQLFNAKII